MRNFFRELKEKKPFCGALLTEVIFLALFLLVNLLLWGVFKITGFSTKNYFSQFLLDFIMSFVGLLFLRIYGTSSRVLSEQRMGFVHGIFDSGLYMLILSIFVITSNLLVGMETGWVSIGQIVIYVLAMAAIGFCEETMFRGVILNNLYEKWGSTYGGAWKAIAVSGVLFGCFHFVNIIAGANTISVLVQVIITSVLGMFIGAIYIRTENLYVVAFLHAFMDFASLSLSGLFGQGTLVSAVSEYGLINLIPVLTYGIPLLFLMRKKKILPIIEERTQKAA